MPFISNIYFKFKKKSVQLQKLITDIIGNWNFTNPRSLNPTNPKCGFGFGVCIFISAFSFFFFSFFFSFTRFRETKFTVHNCSSTVHGTIATLFRKKMLKMGLTALFTHLKIILLQYFQFSVLVKISSIQTDPKSLNLLINI